MMDQEGMAYAVHAIERSQECDPKRMFYRHVTEAGHPYREARDVPPRHYDGAWREWLEDQVAQGDYAEGDFLIYNGNGKVYSYRVRRERPRPVRLETRAERV